MTVRQLIGLSRGREDYELVVRKHDRGQLCCHTTVPVDAAHPGGDWTNNQFILEPTVRLTTCAEEIDRSMRDSLVECSERITRHMRAAARIARMLAEIPDESLRERIHSALKEIA